MLGNRSDMLLSKPQLYGGFGGFSNEAKFVRRQRQRMNAVSVFQCLFAPWLFFCVIYAVTSFELHYSTPWLCWTIVTVGVLIVLACGGLAAVAIRSKMKNDESSEPSWFVFLFITMAVALTCGAVLGNLNFWTFMQPYYDYTNLNSYQGVDVSRIHGEQLMDAGRVQFTEGTRLDLRRSMGFKNLDTYCVAPITTGPPGVDLPLASYDFWAVGLNCCSGDMADFSCGEFNNPAARGGLRLLADNERSFYRLAVQQAEAMYHLKAVHPLFFYWAQDPVAEMTSWKQEGYKFYFIGIFVHFLWQLLSVGLATMGFSKMGHY
mmetsp:Transcript_151013/g.263121  ORF Transcript_151013/g.263121 Transcript_151013/m.263121 type:complete len:319 (-) Transcript_151013:79-1035(-)